MSNNRQKIDKVKFKIMFVVTCIRCRQVQSFNLKHSYTIRIQNGFCNFINKDFARESKACPLQNLFGSLMDSVRRTNSKIWSLYAFPNLANSLTKATVFLERFPIECRKTKTKIISLANRNRCKQHNEPIRIQSKYM